MFFRQIEVGSMQNFSYLLGGEKELLLVDPAWEMEKLFALAKENNRKITGFLLTHGHYDHAKKAEEYADKVEKIYASKYFQDFDSPLLHRLEDGEEILFDGIKIKTLLTPGHKEDAACFLAEDKYLITGDTLFVEGHGRTDLAGGDEEKLQKSLTRLKQLDQNIVVYSGHDYGAQPFATIGEIF